MIREISFPRVGKRLAPTTKYKKLTYSNSSLELWKERKYATELTPVKSYKECFVFLVAKTLKDIRNLFLKLAKVFHNSLSHLKPMSHFIPMLLSILELSRIVKNLSTHKQIKKHKNITNKSAKFVICLNCNVFIESVV